MKQTILNLTMAVAMILGATATSSCAGFVDALLGHEDNPAETPTKPTTSDGDTNNDMSLPPGAGMRIIDLSTLTENYTCQDFDVLTGTLDGEKTTIKLSVPDGATVILSNAQILGEDKGESVNLFAGLTCLGSATIILDGENTVRSFDRYYPCIQPGPEGSKLTIKGDGKLTTEGDGDAGIGISNGIACGDIEILGGDITLKDTYVGIGGSFGSCGDITISGGTIMAQSEAVGIGSGGLGSCGDITISGGTIMAQRGNAAIGSEGFSSCGNITISGGTIMAQSDFVGIGSCYESSCGDINISCGENFVSLTAIKGNDVESPIGGFGDSECGDIIFDGITIKAKNAYYYNTVIGNGKEFGNLKLTISTTLPEGVNKEDEGAVKPYKDNTWTLTPIVH